MKKYYLTLLFFLGVLFLTGLNFPAAAVAFDTYTLYLDSGFPNKSTGEYGTVEFEKMDNGDIRITVSAGPGLGDSDKLTLDKFYFNTGKKLNGLESDSFYLNYDFGGSTGKYKPGGAGYFDGVLSFKNKKGEPLTSVSFILSTLTGDLDIDDFLFGSTDSKHGTYFIATHWTHSDVKFVGTPVPIPGAFWLLCSGFIGIAAIRKRPSKNNVLTGAGDLI